MEGDPPQPSSTINAHPAWEGLHTWGDHSRVNSLQAPSGFHQECGGGRVITRQLSITVKTPTPGQSPTPGITHRPEGEDRTFKRTLSCTDPGHFSSVAQSCLTLGNHQASLSITNSWSLFRVMSMESVMPSSHLILCHPLLLLPSNLSQHQGLFQ